jgi:hypothetical protein
VYEDYNNPNDLLAFEGNKLHIDGILLRTVFASIFEPRDSPTMDIREVPA